MRISAAYYADGALTLATPDAREALKFCYEFKPGLFDIIKTKLKRSRDANSYCWVLIDKLSAALSIPKSEIYRNAIKDIGGVTESFALKAEAADRLCAGWARTGLGWQTDVFPCATPGFVNVILYYGSSSYDTKQMSQLIDHIIQDCKALEIETLPPHKIAAMMEAWDGRA